MRVEDYLRFGMPTLPDHVASLYKDVRDQAAAHTTRNKKERILSKARPSRPESLKKYVLDNVRLITVGEYRKFILKTSRLLKSNDLQIHTPEGLNDWIDGKEYTVGVQKTDLWTWIYNALLPASLKDPNGYVIPFPYWNGNIPPYRSVVEGGIPANEQPKIEVRIIGSDQIRFAAPDIVVWHFDKEIVNKNTYDVYMCCDVDGYTLLRPSVADGKVVYYGEAWFDADKFLAVPLMGHEDTNHKESYIHSMYEYFDEFDSTFADNQAVRVQHAYPKVVMDAIPCQSAGCVMGQKSINGKLEGCKECNATGYIQNPDVYSVLTRPPRMPSDTSAVVPPIEYMFPPTESLNITYDVAFDLLKKGKQTVGIDLLVDSSESGTAKRHRLEDYDDMMQALAHGLMTCVVGVLDGIANILLIDGEITYTVPVSFNLQTIQEIQAEFSGAHPSVRESIYLAMVEMRTHGNIDELDVHRRAIELTPLLTMTDDEIRMRLAAQIYTSFDVWLKDNAVRLARQYPTKEAAIAAAREEYEGLNR